MSPKLETTKYSMSSNPFERILHHPSPPSHHACYIFSLAGVRLILLRLLGKIVQVQIHKLILQYDIPTIKPTFGE
jgi:hypothetical protein